MTDDYRERENDRVEDSLLEKLAFRLATSCDCLAWLERWRQGVLRPKCEKRRTDMNRKSAKTGIRIAASMIVVVGIGVLGVPTTGNSETQGNERRDDRQEAQGTRQNGRESARDAKQECKEGDEKSRAECRKEKRETKEGARDAARDQRKGD